MAYKIKKPHLTKKYARYRVQEPSLFEKSSFRTQDIGRKEHSKRIAGIKKSSGKYETQAILIAKKDYEKGTKVKLKYGRPVIVKEK
jgi:hypothetical protein